MGRASLQAETATVRRMTDVCDSIVDDEGGRFRIRGRTGQKFPLEARGNVKTYASREGVPLVRGAVRGIPEGFWAIVQQGSFRHIITSRKGRGGVQRQLRSGRQAARFLSVGATTKRIQRGQSLGRLQPVRTPYGPRQFVNHPGHGPIGDPWGKSMERSRVRLPDVLQVESAKRLVERFQGVKR
jgi:hypothetical protein